MESNFNNQPDPPALSPDGGERFSETDLKREELRREAMLRSGPRKEYTAEEFHRELAARLVEQARREREAQDRVAQKELIVRFDKLDGKVVVLDAKIEKANDLKRQISDKVDALVVQSRLDREAFGIDQMSPAEKLAAPKVFAAWVRNEEGVGEREHRWQFRAVLAGVALAVVTAAGTLYNVFVGVQHTLPHP
ncbi:MAG: hypothetical protein NVS3B24_24330 [Candidatus Dormibacteria bacterium]